MFLVSFTSVLTLNYYPFVRKSCFRVIAERAGPNATHLATGYSIVNVTVLSLFLQRFK